ncbi:MAG: hypothetical protein NUV57_05295 [archaeon]|nr:hypothetical protein [archaeon]
MEEDKGVIEKHKLVVFGGVALLVAGLIFLIIIIIAALVFFISFPEHLPDSQIAETPKENTGIPNSVTEPPNSSPVVDNSNTSEVPDSFVLSNDSLWATIKLSLVEENCLSQAKIQAGDLDWAVNSCSCSETKTDSEKKYSCSVSALDGPHDLQVNCIKDQNNCIIISEQGEFIFTFEQLYSLT